MMWQRRLPPSGFSASSPRKRFAFVASEHARDNEPGVLPVALMPVADALAAILAGAEPLPEEMVALDAAWHRVLARDVAARRTQPPQAMSAMDGYAVRAADAGNLTARLKVIGEVAAGRPFERKVGAGEAVRIFTGGGIPPGAAAGT